MGKSIVPLEGAFEREEARGWEGMIFRQVCEEGQQKAQAYLERLEEELYEQRPAGWVVVGFRERVLVTRMGEVSLRRRMYRDESGGTHYLLDEHLGLKAYQKAMRPRHGQLQRGLRAGPPWHCALVASINVRRSLSRISG